MRQSIMRYLAVVRQECRYAREAFAIVRSGDDQLTFFQWWGWLRAEHQYCSMLAAMTPEERREYLEFE